MYTHADQTQENKSQAVSVMDSQIQSGGESTFQFVDNRPEAVAQRKLQEMANNSPRTMQLKAIQEMVNNSYQAKQTAQLQTMANNHSTQQQQPIQKKENNAGLPDNLKTGMENLSGMSLDDVRVHRNSDKPAQLQAHAYAQGTDIHLGPRQEKHLPHELGHVVQQKQGRVKPTTQLKGKVNINDDAGLEKEADMMGEKAKSKLSQNETNQLKIASPQPILIQKASWVEDDGVFTWDEVKDGVTWFANESGMMWFNITDANAIEKGNSDKYEALRGQSKTWAQWNEISIEPHPSYSLEAVNSDVLTHEASAVPLEAQQAIEKFSDGGLLIKTVQNNNAHLDFQDAGAEASELSGVAEGRYGPKRNWSLIHKDIIANPYLMASTAEQKEDIERLTANAEKGGLLGGMAKGKLKGYRSMGLLADPSAIGNDRFIGIHEKDQSSNSTLSQDTSTIPGHDVPGRMEVLRDQLLRKQQAGSGRIDNSEIQTVGFSPNSVLGFLFKPGSFSNWDAAKPHFQNVVNTITSPSELPGYTPSTRTKFFVFTFAVNEANKSTSLTYIDILVPEH